MKIPSRFFYFWLLFVAPAVVAQDCTAIFPDGVSSSHNSGNIIFRDSSILYNSPDNILDTRNLSVPTYNTLSCNGSICSKSNNTVPEGTALSMPNASNVNLGYREVRTLSPGAYGSVNMGSESVLRFQPGDYTFSGSFSMAYLSRLEMTADGSARIWVKQDFTVASQAQVGTNNLQRTFFVYSDRDMVFSSPSQSYGIFYAKRNVNTSNQTRINGAVTARSTIDLGSASYVIFEPDRIQLTDFGSFCTSSVVLPAPVAEYQLETLWTASPGDVIDSSGNDLHGRAVAYSGNLPSNDNANPALSGDPGTCRYGIFNGTSSGHLRIEDNALLDIPTNLSVGVWVYPTALPSGGGLYTIVSKDENFEFHLNSAGRVFWWWGGGSRSLTTSASVPLNQWSHITITYEVGEQKIFINGVQAAVTNYNGNMTQNGDPLLIGTDLNFNSRNFRGRIDEVVVFRETLSAAQVQLLATRRHACGVGPQLTGFLIDVGAGNASVCAPRSISISAMDGNNVIPDYSQQVSITTSTTNGDWSTGPASPDPAQGTLLPGSADSGVASYQFVSADGGSVALMLSNQHAESLTVTVTGPGAVSSTSTVLTFAENAFDFSYTDSLGNDVVAGRDHDARVSMLRRDASVPDGNCGPAQNYNVVSIKAWWERNGQDPGGALPVIRNSVGALITLPETEPSAANTALNFASGVADFELVSGDVSKWRLNFKDDASSYSDQAILGDSGTRVVRPFAFDVTAVGNPAGVTPTDPAFMAAGINFTVNVRAVLWQASDDFDDDGRADGHNDGNPSTGANLSDNAVAPSFGLENPAEAVRLSSVLIAPSGGNDPGLGNGASAGDGRLVESFGAGVGQTTEVYFADVGAIELNGAVADGDYLVSGSRTDKILGSAYVGRFIPAGFQLTGALLNEACGSFTYMEQPLTGSFSLTAVNGRPAPATTANYQGAYARLSESMGTLEYGGLLGTANQSPRLDNTNDVTQLVGWSAGLGQFTINSLVFKRQASSAPEAPLAGLQIGLAVADADGATFTDASLDIDVDNNGADDHALLGQTDQRYGRLRARDAFGPESANIPMFWQTEYYNGSQFLRNGDDSCTQIALDQVSFVGASYSVDPVSDTLTVTHSGSGISSVFDFGNPWGAGACGLTATAIEMCEGNAGRWYGATGATVDYPIDINLANYPHLRFDWNADGDHSDASHPRFTVNFESYRGHDRVIYWREQLTP
ncbi:LamG domain-containing protein [Simiduia agarivorans]|uniref:MSHA biogenesis protein, MshQ n=1 Tax=Simiduia agarivorans (strain DSM 21679 / JCM 13881 / BCRC 17597 / SA1) TaxID=1117647 RepID=K4KVT0_SIMAS|nr:LamG domain-containing protein [Simiduia agarivorans]AFU98047.2 MSHA biogenesis protein, MshQ [Simiduia agarivorans SA1 = DSM 21679]